jgi:hypothetical protein
MVAISGLSQPAPLFYLRTYVIHNPPSERLAKHPTHQPVLQTLSILLPVLRNPDSIKSHVCDRTPNRLAVFASRRGKDAMPRRAATEMDRYALCGVACLAPPGRL